MDLDVKLKFGYDFNIDEALSENLECGIFQSLKIVCKGKEEMLLNPLLMALLFPWLRDKINISDHDVIILPDHQLSNLKEKAFNFTRSYKASLNLKCEVKLEDCLDKQNSDSEIPEQCEDINEDQNKPSVFNNISEDNTNLIQLKDKKETIEKHNLSSYLKCHKDGTNKCSICTQSIHPDDILNHFKLEHSGMYKSCDKLKNSSVKINNGKKTRKHKHRLCPECGKSVKNLSKHSLIHKGIKPARLQCHICEKTLCSANALKVHIESVHEGIKRYSCNICSTSFVYEAYLKQHIQVVHEGFRPPEATCPDCGKQFKFISNMTRHRRITHRGENIQRRHFCQICKSMFMKVSLLHKHMREDHAINPRKREEVKKAVETNE